MKLDELRELNINDLSDSLKPLQESLTDTKKELDKEANALHSTLKNLNTELSYESLDSKSEDSKNAESNMPHATAQNLESAESTQDSTLTYKNTTSSKSQDSTPQHIG